MSNELTTVERNGGSMARVAQFGEMSVQAVVDRKRKILEVMRDVMKEDKGDGQGGHYGLIPGCGLKPTLFKSGAEILATTFGLSPRFVVVQTDLGNGHREYRVTCTLIHIPTDANCGEGVGSCSTMEAKYRWRGGSRKCPKCGKETIIKGKDEYGGGWLCFAKKGGCGAKWPNGAAEIEKQETGKIENPDIADVWNTCLKMGKKRAQVDATLTAVGASDMLTQDLEDLPAASVPVEPEPEPAPAPRTATVRSTGKRVEVKAAVPVDTRPPDEDFPPEAPADDNLYAPLPDDWDRALVERELNTARGTGGEVAKAAKTLGFAGKAIKDFTDAELCALDRLVWRSRSPV